MHSDVHETTSLIKDIKQLQNRSCDSIILDYFNPFKGKSFTEIAEQFHFTIPKNISPKQTNFMLVDHMLGSNTSISKDPNDDYVSFDAEELKGIRVKTLPLFHGNLPSNLRSNPFPISTIQSIKNGIPITAPCITFWKPQNSSSLFLTTKIPMKKTRIQKTSTLKVPHSGICRHPIST